MITKIISAFPGTGKSHYHNAHPDTTLDSDSSMFSKSDDFPENYINHIKENIGKYDIIFVSSHKVVRDALRNNCMFFYLIYPSKDQKDIYLDRYRKRGSPDQFVKLIKDNWDCWIDECSDVTECVNMQMTCFDYMDAIINAIKNVEKDMLMTKEEYTEERYGDDANEIREEQSVVNDNNNNNDKV